MNYFYLHTTNSITLVLAGNTIKLSLTFQRFLNAKSYMFYENFSSSTKHYCIWFQESVFFIRRSIDICSFRTNSVKKKKIMIIKTTGKYKTLNA